MHLAHILYTVPTVHIGYVLFNTYYMYQGTRMASMMKRQTCIIIIVVITTIIFHFCTSINSIILTGYRAKASVTTIFLSPPLHQNATHAIITLTIAQTSHNKYIYRRLPQVVMSIQSHNHHHSLNTQQDHQYRTVAIRKT